MRCAWCGSEFTPSRRDAIFCKQACRQAAFRLRRQRETAAASSGPLRFAYADPPYPGKALRYYAKEPSFAGEVDLEELIPRLRTFDGWALSTSAEALQDVLPLCPPGVRICPWVKPIGAPSRTRGLHNAWEPLLVWPGRKLEPGKRDWLRAQPARGGGTLTGRKPLAFCAFLFEALGMQPGDELEDLFPGTGIVGRAWSEIGRSHQVRDASPEGLRDASRRAPGDASSAGAGDACDPSLVATCHGSAAGDASRQVLSDASQQALDDGWSDEDTRAIVEARERMFARRLEEERAAAAVGDAHAEAARAAVLPRSSRWHYQDQARRATRARAAPGAGPR